MNATKTNVEGFEDDFGRDLAPAMWTLPNGEIVLCCEGDDGFILYDRDSWNAASLTDWEADAAGHVTRQGNYVDFDAEDWIVPESVRNAAIA